MRHAMGRVRVSAWSPSDPHLCFIQTARASAERYVAPALRQARGPVRSAPAQGRRSGYLPLPSAEDAT
ncbi:hypothetical protein XAP412_270057 [Xanthomonas phaseoli pv. phaseoli]|nr:hypothetical protein XAP412_270057 [Xanthomonas phaseoli pv. phaseoli]SOO27122.1 hypothetical protein XAP6164_1280009 [Xanthomonas phaseoli pv. phaseoli]